MCQCTHVRAVQILRDLRVRKRKNRNRSHSEVNDAVGIQRIGATGARIVTTSVLKSADGATPGAEIAGV